MLHIRPLCHLSAVRAYARPANVRAAEGRGSFRPAHLEFGAITRPNGADLAPTFLTAAGLAPPKSMTGRSLLKLLASKKSGIVDPSRDAVYAARERHAWCRIKGLGYPMRCGAGNTAVFRVFY